jgi:hypothetical protein
MLHQWLMMACLSLYHPFFVSMTEMDYNTKDKELEVSVRIFTDDLENTIRKYHPGIKVDILHPANQEQMNQFVNEYIVKHLQMKINGATVPMAFAGYEQQNESIWSYFEVKNVSVIKKLDLTNSLLHDYNTNQINMMHVKVGDNEQNYKLDYPETGVTFSF